MQRFDNYVICCFCWLCTVMLLSACGATTNATNATPISTAQTVTYTPTNCIKTEWTYSVAIPVHWRSVPTAGCEVQFQDSTVSNSNRIALDDQGESEFFVAGIGIRGRIDMAANQAGEVTWVAMQPNHSNIVEWQPVSTPIGPGRVYTLDRDRVASTRTTANPTWRGQYAYVPKGDISYEVWVQVDKTMQGRIDPTLTRILNSLVVPNSKAQK